MMSDLFLKVLNLSISASWMILAILILRLFLKKTPRWIICALWGLVAIRLICPLSIESAFSLVPSVEVIPENVSDRPTINTEIPAVNDTTGPVIAESFTPDVGDSANPLQVLTAVFSMVWICGVALLIVYAFVSFLLLKRRVLASIPVEGGVMICDEIRTPFILDVLRPVIYIPSSVGGETYDLVLAHERAHLKRRDHLWKPVGFAILTVYWFNPLCWLSYVLLCRDIEAACDEKVIREKDKEYIAAYSQALLDLSVTRKIISASPLAFGENGVKERVKSILNYKKPAFWVIVCSVILCVILAVCFLTNPLKRLSLPDNPIEYKAVESSDGYIAIYDPQGRIYVPYMAASPDMIQECIGYYSDTDDAESVIYVCSLKGLSEEEWICDTLSDRISGHMESMILREVNVTNIPKGFSSEYDWNRIESNQMHVINIPNDYPSGKIDVSRPNINLSDTTGADDPTLLYADSDRIIFSGYFGLFVYSKAEHDFITSLDLEPIGCNLTQGDDACEMFVSENGTTVYMHVMSSDEMYVYDIQTDLLRKEAFDLSGVALHDLKPNEEGALIDVWDGEDRKMTTRLSYGSCIGELGYIECGLTSADIVIPYYPFFAPDGFSGATDFEPKDIQDIVSADIWVSQRIAERLEINDGNEGLLHCEDKDILSEITGILSKADRLRGQTECPFTTALYLTKSDGTIGWIFPATDSCGNFVSNGNCYEYADSGDELWKFVNRFDPIISNAAKTFGTGELPVADNPVGVSMTAMDVQPVGCMLFFTQSGGNVTGQLQTGQWYEIQTQNLNGEWADCSDRDIEGNWEDIAYPIEKDATKELLLNWEYMYGWLSDGHYRITKKIMDYRAPGDYDEYEVYAEFDITEENNTREDVRDWMSMDLPTGYYTGGFYDNIGWMGGALILPRANWETSSETAPIEWQYSGLISRIPAANTNVTFDNGLPNPSGVPINNHTDSEYLGVIGLERSTNQWPAIELKESHDLYTASEIEDMKKDGKDIDNLKLTADYWYFWFVKKEADTYYVLSLSADYFSQEEAERVAKTIVIK